MQNADGVCNLRMDCMNMGNVLKKIYSVEGAERKTSLGRDWHPTCLKCVQCGRVLSPGNHAEDSKEVRLSDVMRTLREVKTSVTDTRRALNSQINSVKQKVSQLSQQVDTALQVLASYLQEEEEEEEELNDNKRQHKGNPYCHTPCYNALFGPSLLGYGSNLASPANFARKDNAAEYFHDYDDEIYKREIYSNSRSAAAAARRQRQRQSAPPSIAAGHNFAGSSSVDPDLSLGGGGVALSSTQSADNLGVVNSGGSTRYGDANSGSLESSSSTSHPLIPSSRNWKDDDDNVASAPINVKSASNSPSPKRVGSHFRSKSEHGISVEDRPGSFVVVGGDGREKDRKLTTVAKANSFNSPRSSRGEKQSSGSSLSASSYISGMPSSVLPMPGCVRYEELKRNASSALRDVLERVESFNSHFEGKVHHQMTVDQSAAGEVKVKGPLRIYWGLSRPIQLRQCDDVPALPISKWRHSLCANLNEGPGAPLAQKLNSHGNLGFAPPNRLLRGIDDCVLLSPSTADEVVMRRQKVRKFNTVAYRSDAPTKWKRASINGHIFNYDTSVFIPVLGSSTTVMADSTMTSPVVIKTLLEKFKVENSPGQYVLSVVMESGDQTQERVLGEGDRPLLERLQLGADDHYAKIFLKERNMEPEALVPDTVQLPIMEEEEEETLPAEVEQLMILPVAVLKGIMLKYEKDEEKEVRMLKAKYERVKRKIRQRLEELRTA